MENVFPSSERNEGKCLGKNEEGQTFAKGQVRGNQLLLGDTMESKTEKHSEIFRLHFQFRLGDLEEQSYSDALNLACWKGS